ncbi:MAG TPA: serine kinase [Candidatus Hydrogenedentes bacterium]|nr:MAG: hypothetical protein BWY07_01969 [Candidatus Hydrogenedentes bacterium ADurb.Bin170]HOD94674.1 serine kinase [Candidatus Hydrogenedentota bacterium]HOR50201.1 serine kinase [Candidatus Hydrogenedentota bacterium]HPK25649.1 serine kinase [Candidatus Hydrogenedentota bacterium]HQB03163.1 serine kinase [Candidatus Hydrogenedentota bacterium]
MLLTDLVQELGLTPLTPQLPLDEAAGIERAYVSDLLSDVMGNAPGDGVLITVQVHANVVAVASLAAQKAIIFAMNRRPDENTCLKAAEEGIHLFSSSLPAFEIAGMLYRNGVRSLKE